MSYLLWKSFFEDDIECFRRTLHSGFPDGSGQLQKPLISIDNGHNSLIDVSGRSPLGKSPGQQITNTKLRQTERLTLTRSEINYQDLQGLTLLHHIASSVKHSASAFVDILLQHPLIDLYIQDPESGWTALHRAFYFGNITVAHAILTKDSQVISGTATGVRSHSKTLGLIRIKDREGLGPLDLYAATVGNVDIVKNLPVHSRSDSQSEDDEEEPDSSDHFDRYSNSHSLSIKTLEGDECYTFGSNRNITLGFGDQDDRQKPEKVQLIRPAHLPQMFYQDYLYAKTNSPTECENDNSVSGLSDSTIPWLVQNRPIEIKDVQMAKYSTAILTNDPESNLYICGHGLGGRLGLGHEKTQFRLVCVNGGALTGQNISFVALGQNHTLAVSDGGDIFSWGSNTFNQLGYSLPKVDNLEDASIQLVPRQIFGQLKKELVSGVAASKFHSVAFSGNSLYTWGKNEGQLGLVDSDARSLECQTTPRKVAASLFSTSIAAVNALDRATICLLSGSHDCWVFANYGYSKIQFPLDGLQNPLSGTNMWAAHVDMKRNYVEKIIATGDTICAVSSTGEVYSTVVSQSVGMQALTSSTTNPVKIRAAISQPVCVWSPKKSHMAAIDVAVDSDGSMIICTKDGSVWQRSRRLKATDSPAFINTDQKVKAYKISRVSGLTRVIGVRASGNGAYTAIRKNSDIAKREVTVDPSALLDDIFPMLSFHDFILEPGTPESQKDEPLPRFWRSARKTSGSQLLQENLARSQDAEKDLIDFFSHVHASNSDSHDLVLASTVSDLKVPAHKGVLSARSKFLREKFTMFGHDNIALDDDFCILQSDTNGKQDTILFKAIDPLTLINLVLYCYTDKIIDYWHNTAKFPHLAARYRTIRTEMMKIAGHLQMHSLESSVRQMITPPPALKNDFDFAYRSLKFLETGDIIIDLADGEMQLHSIILCQRCPFFQGLFIGSSNGGWIEDRRALALDEASLMHIDLTHINNKIFDLVARHLYADVEEQLFDEIVSTESEDFCDFVISVLSVANELMIDRLAQICQKLLANYVTPKNVCSLANSITPCYVSEFKHASLEYMCANMEDVLHSGHLEELDVGLLAELDVVVKNNQLTCMPFARSGRVEALLHERHPELAYTNIEDQSNMLFRLKQQSQRRISQTSTPLATRSSSRVITNDSESTKLQSKHVVQASPMLFTSSPALDGMTPELKQDSQSDLKLGQSALDDLKLDNQSCTPVKAQAATPNETGSISATEKISHASQSPKSIDLLKDSHLRPLTSPLASKLSSTTTPPWSSSPVSGAKLEFKDIMSQTSTNRISNLTASLAASKANNDVQQNSVITNNKLSQKERKKMQQQLNTKLSLESEQTQTRPLPWSSGNGSSSSKTSPWQVATNKSRPSSSTKESLEVPITSSSPNLGSSFGNDGRRTSTPQLTMRQTVANAKSPTMSSEGTPSKLKSPASRSVTPSTPFVTRTTPNQTPITSVTHISPMNRRVSESFEQKAGSASKQSMLSILYQQQDEKDSIARVVAENSKRSLDDIQTEQTFQEWWDREERRLRGDVDEEETDAASTTKAETQTSRRGRSRGGRGGRGGRIKSNGTTDRQSAPEVNTGRPTRGSNEQRRGSNNKTGPSSRT